MEKKILIFMTAVLVLMIAAVIFIPSPKKKNNPAPPPPNATSPNLKLYNLVPNQVISSPLIILGESRSWYFEGSFPVKLVDEKMNLITAVPAEAKGDWMTNEFVPFEVQLKFQPPASAKGFVILEKDNPSGLEKNAESVQIPVIFKNSEK